MVNVECVMGLSTQGLALDRGTRLRLMVGDKRLSMAPAGLSLQPCATPHRGDLMIVLARICPPAFEI